ncbi:MAG: DUF2164 domain-containing protein [Allorhizobium sp.]
MANIDLPDDIKLIAANQIRDYLRGEFDLELGRFEAETVLEFFTEKIGAHFYNRGLMDAQALLASQVEIFNDGIYQLEKPVDRRP